MYARIRSIAEVYGAVGLAGSNLPIATTVPFAPLLDAMHLDKKARGAVLRFVVLDGIEDPHNVGAILRTVDAAGAHGVVRPVEPERGISGSVHDRRQRVPHRVPDDRGEPGPPRGHGIRPLAWARFFALMNSS